MSGMAAELQNVTMQMQESMETKDNEILQDNALENLDKSQPLVKIYFLWANIISEIFFWTNQKEAAADDQKCVMKTFVFQNEILLIDQSAPYLVFPSNQNRPESMTHFFQTKLQF